MLNPPAILRGFGRSFRQIRMISKLHARATTRWAIHFLKTNAS